jgi:molybdate transport system ATP-binding protein
MLSLRRFTKKDFYKYPILSRRKVDQDILSLLLNKEESSNFELMVKMINVTVRYDDHIILKDINWTIKQGERWSLSGPNGAGKTTLLSLINGDNPQAFANTIILFDRKKGSGESIWDIKSKIGFFSPELFQFFPLNTTCLAAVTSGFFDTMGLFRKVSVTMKTTSMNWLKLMKIDHLAHKPLRTITPGQKRLCLLARALVKNAPLLILDEPCQGLNEPDKIFIKEIIDFICQQTNLTLLYVSHYREEIPESVTQFFELHKP